MVRQNGAKLSILLVLVVLLATVRAGCDIEDKCSGEQLWLKIGEVFQDSCGAVYQVKYDCVIKPLCVDHLKRCKALRDRGECGRDHVLKNCMASCGECELPGEAPTPTPACEDLLVTCPAKARDGLCGRAFIARNCALSCGECDGTPAPRGDCENQKSEII